MLPQEHVWAEPSRVEMTAEKYSVHMNGMFFMTTRHFLVSEHQSFSGFLKKCTFGLPKSVLQLVCRDNANNYAILLTANNQYCKFGEVIYFSAGYPFLTEDNFMQRAPAILRMFISSLQGSLLCKQYWILIHMLKHVGIIYLPMLSCQTLIASVDSPTSTFQASTAIM